MKKKLYSLLFLLSFGISFGVKADEGMWLPMLIQRLNYQDMQKMGLQLTAEEIYSVNNSSLKDAIVQFGGFCTGEIISKEGLLLTNHHCGYGSIQSHSTPEHDYLTNGFWAMTKEQELPNPDLFVDILVRMDDVTAKVLDGIDKNTSEAERSKLIAERMKSIATEAANNGQHVAYVRDFFNGNEYYLFVYDRYSDVRLVGTPPESIGKFGGDTDNWMWPRHTGDFSLFRVYMSPDGKPAKYSKENVPLKPKHYLPISTSGIQEGDFAMVFGFPGRTQRFLTSAGLKQAVEQSNPARVKLRERRLAMMKEDMDADKATRIKYAAKYAQVSNYHKYFIGQNEGIKRMKTVEGKVADEEKYQKWTDADANRKANYGSALSDINKAYAEQNEYNLSSVYLSEAALAPELNLLAFRMIPLYNLLKEGKTDAAKKAAENLKETATDIYKNYNASTDKKIYATLMQMYYNDISKTQHPEVFATVGKKYKGDMAKYADYVYKKSILDDEQELMKFLENPDLKTLEKDPGFMTMHSIYENYTKNISPKLAASRATLEKANRLYVAGLREMNPDKKFYPDANSTIRLSFGTVQAYEPRDGVKYQYYTTMEGIAEKADPTDPEFVVPEKLLELYRKKDYGQYAQNGEMPVAFITNNDITGGNSGSPVINGRGELIGLAFDGNWEAMTGDLVYDPEYKRCINVDARYVLFIIDKFAGAGHLVKEMTLVDNGNPSAANYQTKEAVEAAM